MISCFLKSVSNPFYLGHPVGLMYFLDWPADYDENDFTLSRLSCYNTYFKISPHTRIFNLKCMIIEFIIQNLSLICIYEKSEPFKAALK